MRLDEVLAEWQQDSEFSTDMVAEGMRIPKLHNKWYPRYLKARRAEVMLREQHEALEQRKRLYYSGAADPDEYRKRPFNKAIKSQAELAAYVKFDPEVVESRHKLERVIELRIALEEVIRQVNSRNFYIRNILEAQGLRGL